jgi:hypothetical protein
MALTVEQKCILRSTIRERVECYICNPLSDDDLIGELTNDILESIDEVLKGS